MYTLSISQIFSNLGFYQDHYLNIIHSPEQYFTQVEGAYIDLWPFKKQSLYLGDLLQLWFAQKWQIARSPVLEVEHYLAAMDVHHPVQQSAYIYAITANLFTGSNQTQLWNVNLQQSQCVVLDSSLKNYCEFLACHRPKSAKSQFYRRLQAE